MLNESNIADATIRMICPLIILFGVYLIMNGHISPGGGFQGGVVLSAVFICRYIIHDIRDIKAEKVKITENLIFIMIALVAAAFVFTGAYIQFPALKSYYLILMNLLIGLKVTCGFFIIFYKFIVG